MPNSNCSQTVFDEAASNYMASFTFHSTIIDQSCPTAKAIAFKKNDLLEVEMEIQILNEIWSSLNAYEKASLVAYIRRRFHFSCNSQTIPTELCRSNYALEGGVYISTYDGSLIKHQFQKSCSVCLLKTNTSEEMGLISNFDLPSPTIAYLNLTVSDAVNVHESTDDEILSVKFVRSPDKSDIDSKFLLKNIIKKLVFDQPISVSASLFYKIKVKLNSNKPQKKPFKSSSVNSDNCLFRCDWSSICLNNMSLICNNKHDCKYGDDENIYICQLFHNSNKEYRREIKNSQTTNSKLLENNYASNKENIPVILSIILLSVALVSIGIVFLIYLNIRNRNSNAAKKHKTDKEISHFCYDDPSFSSLCLHKSRFKDSSGSWIINELLESRQKEVYSGICNSSIHEKMQSIHKKGKLIKSRYLKQKENDHSINSNNKHWCFNDSQKINELCSQISFPDSAAKSSWLRSYFQMTKIRHQVCVKAPLVVNISKLSPMSFSCND